jgi:hypothetical protein
MGVRTSDIDLVAGSDALQNIGDVIVDRALPGYSLRSNGQGWGGFREMPHTRGGHVYYIRDPVITPTGAQNAIHIGTLTNALPYFGSSDSGGTVTITTVVSGWTPGAAFLYNALLQHALPVGYHIANLYLSSPAWVKGVDTQRAIFTNFYNVITQDGGTVTITTSGTGTSRIVTASGGTPFHLPLSVSGSPAPHTDNYLQTASGIYRITARTSDTIVTIEVPAGYVNQAAVTFNRWKTDFSPIENRGTEYISGAGSPTLYSAYVPVGIIDPTPPLNKFGVMLHVTASPGPRTITVNWGQQDQPSSFEIPW